MSFSEAAPAARTTVLVVEDGEARHVGLPELVASADRYEVVAEAKSGYEAIRATHDRNPDVVVLALRPMDMRGIELLAYISAEAPRPVVVVSPEPQMMADPALATVDFGNIEFVLRPPGGGEAVRALLRQRLHEALDAAANARIGGLRMNRARRAAARASRAARRAGRAGEDAAGVPARCVLAIASSTGGPRALLHVMPRLPADTPAAVLIVQHMPAAFVSYLAARLDRSSQVRVKEASAAELLKAGVAYIAPGGRHMELQRTGSGVSISFHDGEPVWGLRPAADVLFESVARHFGPRAVGLVLTGMGRDGTAGLRAIHEVGGWTGVQDPTTAVVGSMPRAARPWATVALPLDRLTRAALEQAKTRAAPGL